MMETDTMHRLSCINENNLSYLFEIMHKELNSLERHWELKQDVDAIWKMTDRVFLNRFRKIHLLMNDLMIFRYEIGADEILKTKLMLGARAFVGSYSKFIRSVIGFLELRIEKYSSDLDTYDSIESKDDIMKDYAHFKTSDYPILQLDDLNEVYSLTVDVANIHNGICDALKNVLTILEEYQRCDVDSLYKLIILDDVNYQALNEYIRELANNMSKEVNRELKQQVHKMKDTPTETLSNQHWSKLLYTESMMMDLAVKKQLVSSTDSLIECYKTTDRKLIEENPYMIEKMRGVFVEDELYDLGELPNMCGILNSKNIELFVRLLLRGNIIRCNLYPELKPKFEAWMKGEDTPEKAVEKGGEKEKKTSDAKFKLSDDDKKRLDEIKSVLEKGNWNAPANKEKVVEWIEVLFGAKPKELDKEDVKAAEEFRKFFRTGKGGKSFSRLQVSTANVIGYLMKWGCLDSSPQQLSKVFFDNESNKVNINHGKNNDSSASFRNLIPFMDKYRQRIIEKHD